MKGGAIMGSMVGRAVLAGLLLLQHLTTLLLLLPLISSGGSSSASSKNSSLPVYSVSSSFSSSASTTKAFPTFLSAPTLIQVEAGKVALLECRVTHLSPHHTVSWLRSEDVSVLTVGGLVFSSDPRLHVVTRSRPSERSGSWTLVVEDCQPEDSGSYRCQVNTEPAKSKNFSLVVNLPASDGQGGGGRGSEHSVTRSSEVSRDVVEGFGGGEVLLKGGGEASVLSKSSEESLGRQWEAELGEVDVEVDEVVDEVKENENGEKQSRSIVSVRLGEEGNRFSFAKVEVNELPSDSPALEMRSQEETKDKEDKEEKGDQSKEEEEDESVAIASVPSTSLKMPDLGPTSLAVPVISLFSLVLVVIGIGSIKGLYRRCRPGAEPRPRPRSRASSTESKRSNALRRQRKLDKEEDNVYETFRLAPLVEVVQASPTRTRAPHGLFSLTSAGRETASGESEYSGSTSMCYSENASNVSAPSSTLSLPPRSSLKPALSVPKQQQLAFADSTPSPLPPSFPCALASSESLEAKMEPVGSILCGTVRVSVQREEKRKKETKEVEDSPAYLPTNRRLTHESRQLQPGHHHPHLPILDSVADSVAGARQARGLLDEEEEGSFYPRRLRFNPD